MPEGNPWQESGFCAHSAKGPGSISGQGTKIPQATQGGRGASQRLGGLDNEILIDLGARMSQTSVPADSLPGESSLLGF